MSHDDFESERFRVERVLEILEHAARRLDARAHVPLTVLKDAVAFIRVSEESAGETAGSDDSEPALTACVEQHQAAMAPLAAMTRALDALDRGQASAASRFAQAAREYIDLRREHLRIDDRLFARARRRPALQDETATPIDAVESAETRKLYDRLIEAAAILDIGVPTSSPVGRRR
jgi:hemerythrin-like domain-containing protein